MEKKKVALLGPKYSYSYNVTNEVFGKDVDIIYCSNISDIFSCVCKDDSVLGMVPIENLINGNVRETLVGLKKNKVKIQKAFDYEIHCCLASQSDKFTKIVSHPQPIGQCSDYLKTYRDKGYDILECASTSRAMEMAKEDSSIAGIGSIVCANAQGLKIIDNNIENNSNNMTRFLLISQNEVKSSTLKNAKTSMMIEPNYDRAGLLFEILSVFKIKDINLTKIESIPTGNKIGEYLFYIDVQSDLKEKRMQDAIKFLETFVSVYLFGSYDVERV